jgi:hypothetical protein
MMMGVAVQVFMPGTLARSAGEGPSPGPDDAAPHAETAAGSWLLKGADGQDLRASFAIAPVLDLKAWAMAGHHLESRIVELETDVEITTAQRRTLPPRDFERIDLAALARGWARVANLDSYDRPRLILQLSFASLGAGRGRATLLPRARELQHILRQAVICELVDVDPGVPIDRLQEVISLVRGLFRSLWLQVEPSRQSIELASAASVSGLTVRAVDLGPDEAALAPRMQAFVQRVARPGLLLTVTSLPRPELLMEAVGAGFTHATLRVAAATAAAAAPPPPPAVYLE